MAQDPENAYARDGEPVIPGFPSMLPNTFLGVNSGKPCSLAGISDLEPGAIVSIAETLIETYPGLPEVLHKTYVEKTAVACYDFSKDARLRVETTADTADIIDLESGKRTRLWNTQPIR